MSGSFLFAYFQSYRSMMLSPPLSERSLLVTHKHTISFRSNHARLGYDNRRHAAALFARDQVNPA